MEITNIDEIFEGCMPKKVYKNINEFAPQWPFRMALLGASGGGKTNVICCLVFYYLYFDSLTLLIKDVDEDKYKYIVDYIEKVNELRVELKKEPIELNVYTDASELKDVNEFDCNKQHLLIIDDFINENSKIQHHISEYFIRGRKHGISVIYQAQSFLALDKTIRKNCNYIILFDLGKRELLTIKQFYSITISDDLFFKLYNDCMKNKFGFMMLDFKNNDMRYRNKFDKILKY